MTQVKTQSNWIYEFGSSDMLARIGTYELLGGKGAGLAEMSSIGLPVPPGFTITTDVCIYYYSHGESYPTDLKAQVWAALTHVEATVGATFGDPANPLLVSVRSGARAK